MPQHSKLMQFIALGFFAAGAYTLINARLFPTLILWGAAFLLFIWESYRHKKQTQEFKKTYISSYLPENLCMSIQNPNHVYEIIEQNKNHIKIRTIWSGEQPVTNGEIYEVKPDIVRPFDEETFLMLS